MAARLIVEALERLGSITPEPQALRGVAYAAKLTREEGALDWRQDASLNERKVRALNPAPGVWFQLGGERVKVLAARSEPGSNEAGVVIDRDLGIASGDGIFRPLILQRPGRAAVDRRAFLNGLPVAPWHRAAAPRLAMPRYKLTIEYDGTDLVGWQRQSNGLSVQEILETAFERFTGAPVFVQGAGRTDAGVHAAAQVAHVDLDREASVHEIAGAINFHVRPHAVAVLAAELVDDTFHARVSATRRTYLYRILNRRAPPTVQRHGVWHVSAPLDADAMAKGAARLLGHHDFSTFRAKLCQARSPVKTLDRLTVSRQGEEIHVAAEARSFLYHQVRNMVGTLKLVGTGNGSRTTCGGRWTHKTVRPAVRRRRRRASP